MNLKWVFIFMWISSLYADVFPIAHRGASAYAPENTLSSIRKAIELGTKYIEIDVHMTKDGHIVAIHDSSIQRTSNSSGKVRNLSLLELKEYDFGSWFDLKFKEERIPTLLEVLKVTGKRAVLIIELKYGGNKYTDIEKKIIKIIKKESLSKQVILKSFDYNILNKFEKIAPNIDRLYCTFWGNDWFTIDNFIRFKGIFEMASFKYLQVHKYFLTETLISKAHKRKIKIIVWDVHDRTTMRKYIKMGVDFIETDNPDYVLSL
jgi:glycerophosphoryl diester phosphodiesterase